MGSTTYRRRFTAFAFLTLSTFGCSKLNPAYDAPGDEDEGTDSTRGSDTDRAPQPATTSGVDAGGATGDPSAEETSASSSRPGSSMDGTTRGAVASSEGDSDDSDDDSGVGDTGTSTQRRVFLSSGAYNGDLGGVGGADSRCQELADGAGLGGNWLAYIFDPNNDRDTFPQGGGPFLKLDGEFVATDWEDLTDGMIESPIDLTEQGSYIDANVWTGLFEVEGAVVDNWCYGWTSARGQCDQYGVFECGAAGHSDEVDDAWEGYLVYSCASTFHLYCLES